MKGLKTLTLLAISLLGLSACGQTSGGDEFDGEKLKISMRNLYFGSWAGGDRYLDEIEDRFKVKITPSSYSYNDWNSQVSGAINGNNLTDVFQFNVTQFNYANSYKFWAEGNTIKALPDDLSTWPNLKKMIDNLTSIDSLKINGHLYGIPIA